MKIRFLFTAITALGLLFTPQTKAAYSFKESSKLNSGKWIKIETGETGLYKIPYSTLREMGFENPANVGVYGKGGGLLAVNFSGSVNEGVPYSDDVEQIAVIHENESLCFYALGVEDIAFTPGAIPKFSRGLINLYTPTAYYFLSDSEQPKLAGETSASQNATVLTEGWDFVYHELDLQQNTTDTGQLFWGEGFLGNTNKYEWTAKTPFATDGNKHLAYRFYTSPQSNGSMSFTVGNAPAKNISFSTTGSDKFYEYATTIYNPAIEFAGEASPSTSVTVQGASDNADWLNLDYWLLYYPKSIPTDNDMAGNGALRYFFSLSAGNFYKIKLDPSLRMLDITNPRSMSEAQRDANDNDYVGFHALDKGVRTLIFDPAAAQRSILSWKQVDNTNLHLEQEQGAELLIITTPRFRSHAERIAELHRNYDGIRVVVATPEEIYNEFSAGVPDPMAIRALAKMLHESKGEKLKNILLLGPSDRNLRRAVPGETIYDRIPAVQQASVTPDRAASPAYDFFGVTDDTLDEVYLYRAVMNVGVGLLSCETDEECERAIRKIREYLTNGSQHWLVNETLTLGGLHNDHAHDQQAEDFGNHIRNFTGNRGMAHTTIAVDAYGNQKAGKEFIKRLEDGKNFSVYFGHGSSIMFGFDKNLFTTTEANSLRNRHLGFMFMGGCDFTEPDVRYRGIGETITIDAERGMIGAIVSTRTAWSNQNYDLGKRIVDGWLAPTDMTKSPTIGQVYAKAKSKAISANSLTFILSGDPALRIPSPLRDVHLTAPTDAVPGQKITITGNITDRDGNPDVSFNGKVALKLMEPSIVLRSRDYETNTCNTPVKVTVDDQETTIYYTLDVTYDTNLLTAVETDVADGRFSAELVIPGEAMQFTGKKLRVVAGAFDDTTWLGAAGETFVTAGDTPDDAADIDTMSPTITLDYDNNRRVVAVLVTDDTALPLSSAAYDVTLDNRAVVLNAESLNEDGNSGTLFEAYVDVFNIADGTHTLAVSTTDVAGNKASSEITFEKLPVAIPLQITLSAKAVTDQVEISVAGDYTGDLEYEICDTDGVTAYKTVTAADSIIWDGKTTNGLKATPGLYRVRVRTAANGPVKHSEWESFALFD